MTAVDKPDPHKEAGNLFKTTVTGNLPAFEKMVKYLRLFGAKRITLTMTVQMGDKSKSNHVFDLLKTDEKSTIGRSSTR